MRIFTSGENPAFIALMLEKGTADEVSVDSSSAVFFVYSGANFEKILLGKDLLFYGFRVTM